MPCAMSGSSCRSACPDLPLRRAVAAARRCRAAVASRASRRPRCPCSGRCPRSVAAAASMSLALRSAILIAAISRTWSLGDPPDLLALRRPRSPSRCRPPCAAGPAAGGVLRMNVNERSSKIVIWAGMIWPALSAVRSLYDLVNSTMLMPCGPSAVPTGGAGVALPAGSCELEDECGSSWPRCDSFLPR